MRKVNILRLRIAINAFRTILKGKPHSYSDGHTISVMGTSDDVNKHLAEIAEIFNQEVYQERLVRQTKELLK